MIDWWNQKVKIWSVWTKSSPAGSGIFKFLNDLIKIKFKFGITI